MISALLILLGFSKPLPKGKEISRTLLADLGDRAIYSVSIQSEGGRVTHSTVSEYKT